MFEPIVTFNKITYRIEPNDGIPDPIITIDPTFNWPVIALN